MTPEINITPGRGWTIYLDGWTIVLLDDGTRIVLRDGVIVADGVPVAADWLAPENGR